MGKRRDPLDDLGTHVLIQVERLQDLDDSPFSTEDPRYARWLEFREKQRDAFEPRVAFWTDLMSVTGPSNYWDWALKHRGLFPERQESPRDPETHRLLAPPFPVTYNPDWVIEQQGRFAEVIESFHFRMLAASLTEFVGAEVDRDIAVQLVEFFVRQLAAAIGETQPVSRDQILRWRKLLVNYVKARWPVAGWPTNCAAPEFWREIRSAFERFPGGQFALYWTSVPPLGPFDEPLASRFTWSDSPEETSRARFSAISTRAAYGLGGKSEDDWYEQIREVWFAQFELTGSGKQPGPDGRPVNMVGGRLENILAHSITLTFWLEADSEAKRLAAAAGQNAGGGGLASGYAPGIPHMDLQRDFSRPNSDGFEREVDNLAYRAMRYLTQSEGVRLSLPTELWEYLLKSGYPVGTLEQRLGSAGDYFHLRSLDELVEGGVQRSQTLEELSIRFRGLLSGLPSKDSAGRREGSARGGRPPSLLKIDGPLIKKTRQVAGMTQARLAELCDCTDETIQQAEKGLVNDSLLTKILDAFRECGVPLTREQVKLAGADPENTDKT